MKPVTYGIIGFGGIAENRIVKEGFGLDANRFTPRSDIRLIGACDQAPDRKQAAAAYGLKWYDTAEELLAQQKIDAVYIAVPNSLHTAMTRLALEAGKHVLLEKPMTTTVEEAAALSRLAAERRLSLMVNLMMTCSTFNRKARELIRLGQLGTVDHIVTHMEFLYGSTPEEAASWRCSQPAERGGPIGDVASHCLYMAEFLLGEKIDRIRCAYTPRTLDIAVENGAIVNFVTKNGFNGTSRASFNQPRGNLAATIAGQGYEVYGTDAVLRGYGTLFQLSGHRDEPFRLRLELEQNDIVKTIYLSDIENIYYAQLARHAESIRRGNPLDGADGLHNLALVSACYESADSGGREITII